MKLSIPILGRVAAACVAVVLAAPATALAAPVVTLSMPAGGQRTNDATPPFAGTAGNAAGDDATVTLRVYAGTDTGVAPVRSFDVARAGTDWALPQGAWDAGDPQHAPLGEGGYTLVAEQGSASGTGQAANTFDVDTTAPAAAVTGPATTADRTPTLTGTAGAAPGDGPVQVRIYAGGSLLRTVSASGSPFAAPAGLLPDGDYEATATQGDDAGNSATSAPFAFTVAAGPARVALVRNNDIFSQLLDGTDSVNLTNDVALEEGPSFSADGTKMVYTSTREGQREIYLRDLVTGTDTRLTNTAAHELDPVISPDGTKIAFWRPTCCDAQVYVMDADGSDEVALPLGSGTVSDQQPSWAPDSTQLVVSTRTFTGGNQSFDLTIVNADGSGRHDVFLASGSSAVDEIEPAWSPDGTQIAYRQVPRGTSGAIGELHVVDLFSPGISSRNLAVGGFVSDPAWSGDGAHLLFIRIAPPTFTDELYLIDTDGTGLSKIPTGSGIPRQPAWQPEPPTSTAPLVTLSFPAGGTRTNDATPPFAGTAGDRPGDDLDVNVRVYAGTDTTAAPVRSFVVPRTGTDWALSQSQWDASTPLADGSYTVVAEQEGAGATGRASSTFAVDTAAPAAALTGPPSPIADRTPKLAGTAATAAGDDGFVQVRVYAGATPTGTPVKSVLATVEAGGTFLAAVGLLHDGDYVATASQGDAAGNSATSAPFALTVAAGAARVALVRNPGNDHDVYSQFLDGSGELNLTNDVALDEAPSFSADGTVMVFASTREGQREIYRRDMTTGVVTRLTNTAAHELDPVISPDGTKIAFWRPTCCDTQVYVMDADGTDEHEIPRPDGIVNDQQPAWSPDSTQLVLASRYLVPGNESYDLTIVNADGSGRHDVFLASGSPAIDEIEPAWSPDGDRLAYRQVPRGVSGTVGELHVLDLTGATSSRNLANGGFSSDPAWSADGAHLLFIRVAPPTFTDELYLIDVDGTGLSKIPTGPGIPRQPVWQPEPPPVTTPLLTLTFPSGGQHTADATPPFAGTAGDGAGDGADVTVRVYDGTDTTAAPIREFTVTRSGTAWAVAQAQWDPAVALRAPLGEGHYTVEASQDGPGGTGHVSNAFTVDLTAPAPALTGPPSPIADRTPKLTGTAGAAAGDQFVQVRVYAGATSTGTPVKTVFADGGPFTAAVGYLPDGDYVATATQSDQAGNTGTSAPFPFTVAAGPARLAVVRSVFNNHDIYSSDLDGSGLLNLTNHVALEEAPALSADGSKMVFTSDREGQREIYERDMATGIVTRLTTTPEHEFDPVLSPDGQRIAFWRSLSLDARAYVMNADGTGLHEIPRPDGIVNDQQPAWSPDGSKLVLSSRYFSGSNESYDLTIVDPDDAAGARVLAAAGASPIIDELEPSWSPDGGSIAFRMVPRGASGSGVGQLHVVDLASHEDRFIGTGSFISDPAWSPDGAHIAFAAALQSGASEIGLVDADGTGVSTVAAGPGLPRQPAWIPEPPDMSAPALELEKSAELKANGDIAYGFAITNTGNVPLSGMVLDDALLGFDNVACGATKLAPGDSTSCSAMYTPTQAQIDAGEVGNSATACGTPPSGADACGSDTTTTTIPRDARLTLDKAGELKSNGEVAYTFTIANTGNVTLTGIDLDDALLGFDNVACGATTLLPGVSTTCSATYTPTQPQIDAGEVGNNATACGTPPSGSDACGSDTTTTTIPRDARLTLTKSATPGTYTAAGDVITYTYVLRNTGGATLHGPFVVSDDKIAGTITCGGAAATLAPGATLPGTCTATYTIRAADVNAGGTGAVTNHATATAKDPQNAAVTSNQAEATVRQSAATAKIAPTSTTCADFSAGRAVDLDTIVYSPKGGKINSVAPGVLFYYSAIRAPASAFTITVTQATPAGWRPLPAQATGQILLYDAACAKSAAQRATSYRASDGLATIQVAGTLPGTPFVIGIKYSASDLAGLSVPSPFPTVTYGFTTLLGGTPVITSTDTVKAVPK